MSDPARALEGNGPPRLTAPWLAAAALAGAAILAYSNTIRCPFVFDDLSAIVDNPTIRRLDDPASILRPPPRTSVTGRPVVNATLALNYGIDGLNVRGYHAFNLLVHLSATLALFGVVRRTLLHHCVSDTIRSRATFIAFAASLLWCVHPLQTESVTYVVQRAESLAGLSALLAFYFVLRGAESECPGKWLAASVASCALGLATKESVAVVPPLVLLFDATFLSGTLRAAFGRRRVFYLSLFATLGIVAISLYASEGRNGSAGFNSGTSPAAYAAHQLTVIPHYLQLVLWPNRLILDYGMDLDSDPLRVATGGIGVAALLLATSAAWFKCPGAGFLGTAFFLTLAPTSSIVPVATQAAAEHRMYLPLAAVMTLLAVGFAKTLSCVPGRILLSHPIGRAVPWVVLGIIAAALGTRTWCRNLDYQSNLRMWSSVVAFRPANPRARAQYAAQLILAGRTEEGWEQFGEAASNRVGYLVNVPIEPLDERWRPVGQPFAAPIAGIFPGGIYILFSQPPEAPRLQFVFLSSDTVPRSSIQRATIDSFDLSGSVCLVKARFVSAASGSE